MKKFKLGSLSPKAKILLGVLGIILIYGAFRTCVIYTEDAYLQSNTQTVSAEVSGRVTQVFVHKNQWVAKGAPLIQIDPTPFLLQVKIANDQEQVAEKALPVLSAQLQAIQASIYSDQAHLDMALITQKRDQLLFAKQAVSQQILDQHETDVLIAQAHLREDQANLLALKAEYAEKQALISSLTAKAQLDFYRLSQTQVVAEQSGFVTSLALYPGDTVKASEPLFTLVNNQHWHVVANLKEYNLAHLYSGQRALIYLSTHPYHLYWGEVQSIGRGVARSEESEKALEYINPTVDWIRYDYRFPVILRFGHPPQNLYLGSDARVWILK